MSNDRTVSSVACALLAVLVLTGLVNLAVKLKEVQLDDTVFYSSAGEKQSTRRIRTDGPRGRIFDRHGRLIAGNRVVFSIACDAAFHQKNSLSNTVQSVMTEVGRLAAALGRAPSVGAAGLADSIRRRGAMPVELWKELSGTELARFEERSRDFPGFYVTVDDDRYYPEAPTAAKLIGSTSNAPGETDLAEKFYMATNELRGREGLECYYDAYLRGVPGEDRIRINSLGYAAERWTVDPARPGLDLTLALDLDLQREAEAQLEGCQGACVAIDPRNGDILAAASSSGYFLAFGGEYAPGSTFKPITALAGLKAGWPTGELYDCDGAFGTGPARLRCSSRWGHGPVDIKRALMKSCNPFFCNLGCDIGTNALFTAARAFGLGERTGVDYVLDRAGIVPDAELKARVFHDAWRSSDVALTSIGQGMLLVTPLQMARVAGAIATGYLVKPRLNRALAVERKRLPFAEAQLATVRTGMRMVVAGDGTSRGTGWRGGEGVPVEVCGKTGTAEVGSGESRRKNTWFIAYAPAREPEIAVAMVIERGESGGGTTAPKVAAVLAKRFGGK